MLWESYQHEASNYMTQERFQKSNILISLAVISDQNHRTDAHNQLLAMQCI